jgi:hypothetical protein
VQQLPLSRVVDGGPGSNRPVVIELPVEGSHAVGHGGSPVLNGHLHCHCLLDLGEVEHLFEIGREAEVAGEILYDDGIPPIILLVVFHDRNWSGSTWKEDA